MNLLSLSTVKVLSLYMRLLLDLPAYYNTAMQDALTIGRANYLHQLVPCGRIPVRIVAINTFAAGVQNMAVVQVDYEPYCYVLRS